MKSISILLLLSVYLGLCFSSDPGSSQDEPPLDETRLSIHTLVREDIFAGWRSDNMERHERGMRNVDILLEKRPEARADLLAWKGGAYIFQAVIAYEAGDEEKCKELHQKALDLFAESKEIDPKSIGVASVTGGSLAMFADRLPEELQEDAWQQSYESYRVLYEMQSDYVDQLPNHIKGELLSGLTQTAHRTGRMDEYEEFRDRIIELMPNTSYSRVAIRWKENPEAAATENIACKSCHTPGRLSIKLSALDKD